MITGVLSTQNLFIWQKSTSAITGENGRLFNAVGGTGWERAVINNPQSAGKWFYAVEVVSVSLGAGESLAIGLAAAGTAGAFYTGGTPVYPAVSAAYARLNFAAYKRTPGGVAVYTGATAPGPGVICGVSYDASTGQMRGYNYVSGAWVDRGLIYTFTAGTALIPMVNAGKNATSNNAVRLRPDITPPAGFASWV